MALVSLRMGVLIIITCAVVFTSIQMNVLRYVRDEVESNDASWKPKTVIGEQNTESRTLANRKHGYEISLANRIHGYKFDSAFPFDDESIDENGDEFRTDHDRGIRNDVGREIKNDTDRTITNDSPSPKIKTFFSSLETPFEDVPIGPDKSIPTLEFLDACRDTIQLFAIMKRKILDRVVADVQGNIEKIQWKHDTLPVKSSTLQSMVLYDIEQLRINNNDEDYLSESSIILALEWLVRAFQFISRFLVHICEGEEQTPSAKIAYEETLRKHHGFAVRALFRAAFLTLSTRAEFFKEIAINEADFHRPDFEEIAMADIRDYNIALTERLKVLEEFFLQNDIEV